MSVWGPLPHENDDAADWLAEYLEEPTVVGLNDAFDEVSGLDREDYLEITEGAVAVMAAAVVAELYGKPGPHPVLDDEERAALSSLARKLMTGAHFSLIARAGQALGIVAQDIDRSELAQLMHEDPKLAQGWAKNVASLTKRLQEVSVELNARRKTT